jgi:DNA-binding NarL/FixJ family response regulator
MVAARAVDPPRSVLAKSGQESSSTGTIPVIIAVSPPLWAELLKRALDGEAKMTVVGCAATEVELLAAVGVDPKSVVLFDYEALGPGGEGVIARLRRAEPQVRVVVLARRSGEKTVAAVLRAGAAGLVGKEMDYAMVVRAIRAAAAGEVWANRRITAQVITQLIHTHHPTSEAGTDLTSREWEVVNAVARGLRNNEIARELGISVKTVKTHVNNIFMKTGVKSRFALALWAQGALHQEA